MHNESYSIEINNLSKEYKDFKLSNINLSIPNGSIMGFVGQNGAGKTTTIKSLLNLVKIDSGTVKINGLNVNDNEKEVKDSIGVVFDELGMPASLNCKNVNTIMKNIYTRWDETTFFKYTELFKLPVNKSFSKFSRGMQMKLQTAIALSHCASVLILDEATSGLDPIARNELLDILLEYMEDENHSTLMSSHITSDLERIADYITFIDNGKILLSDEKYNIYNNHALIKGGLDEINSLPTKNIISIRKNSYGCEALITNPDEIKNAINNFVCEKPSLDDILYFYVKRESK